MAPCTPACLMLWLAMPEQTCRAVHVDLDWWCGLSTLDSALCTDVLAELRVRQCWPDLDGMCTFLPAVPVAPDSMPAGRDPGHQLRMPTSQVQVARMQGLDPSMQELRRLRQRPRMPLKHL